MGGFAHLYPYLVARHPEGHFGVDAGLFDSVLAFILDRESRACGGEPVSGFTIYGWLMQLRDGVLTPMGYSTFLWPGAQHTMLQSDELFFLEGAGAHTRTAGWRPADWAAAVVDGAVLQVAP